MSAITASFVARNCPSSLSMPFMGVPAAAGGVVEGQACHGRARPPIRSRADANYFCSKSDQAKAAARSANANAHQAPKYPYSALPISTSATTTHHCRNFVIGTACQTACSLAIDEHPIADGARQPSAAFLGTLMDAGPTGHLPGPAAGPLTNLHTRPLHFAARRNSSAAFSCSRASCSMSRFSSARTARFAQVRSSIDFSSLHGLSRVAPVRRGFLGAPSGTAPFAGASDVGGSAGRAHQEGRGLRVRHALSFEPRQRGTQRGIRLISSFIEAPMDQLKLPLLGRVNGPSVAPQLYVDRCKTYRDAVRMAWALRRIHLMTQRQLAAEANLRPQLVTDYLNPDDKPQRRDLPADRIASFEAIVGNTLVSQCVAARAALTILEEMQATRAAA